MYGMEESIFKKVSSMRLPRTWTKFIIQGNLLGSPACYANNFLLLVEIFNSKLLYPHTL